MSSSSHGQDRSIPATPPNTLTSTTSESGSSITTSRNRFPAGLELFYNQERSSVRCPLDALILAVHWALVRAGLRLPVEGGSGHTEKLPENWSVAEKTDDLRVIEYLYNNPSVADSPWVYALKIMELSRDDTVVVTMFRRPKDPVRTPQPNERTSSALTFQLSSYIQLGGNDESAYSVYHNADEMEVKLWNELLEPIGLHVLGVPPIVGPYDDRTVSNQERREEESQRRPPPRNPGFDEDYGFDPDYYAGPGRVPSHPGIGGPLFVPPGADMGGYGRSDLDPLGRIGGGMLIDPRGRGRIPGNPAPYLPPVAVPPGARFDPFGPPNPGRNPFPGPPGGRGRGNNRGPPWGAPDPDHERPPDGFDDMFM